MLSNSELYRIWRKRLTQLMPDGKYERYRVTNMLMLVVGMYKARSAQLGLIARKIPLRVRKVSITRRLRRTLDNRAIKVREWYNPVASGLLKAASTGGQVHMIIDGSKVGASHQLLMVAIAYQRRALPLAWTWIRSNRGHSTWGKQLALLAWIQARIPAGVSVSLVGDSEFGSTHTLRQLDEWGWAYALRQRGRIRFMPYGSTKSTRFDQHIIEQGIVVWMGRVDLTRKHAYVTNVVIFWAAGYDEPWYLATNLPEPRIAIRLYRRRMWIEEMFGDMKRHGFDLEASHLKHFLRLSRLTLIVCLLYL